MASCSRTAVLLAATLMACAPVAPSTTCLTRSDCAATEQCVAGRCLPAQMDAGPARDSAMEADAFTDRDAYRIDAPSLVDAFAPLDAGPLPGESCAEPIRLTLDVDGRVHAEGELAGYRYDHNAYCGARGVAPDVIFVVDIAAERSDIEIRTSGDDATDTVVSFSETCGGEGEFYSCQDDRAPGHQDTRMILHRYGAPQLFVMVRGLDAEDVGHFMLDITVGPVADTSSCTTAIDLTGGAYVVAWHHATDLAPHPSCLPAGPLVSDVYRLRRDGETNIDYLNVYFGDLMGAVSSVDACAAPVTETWCTPAVHNGSYFEVERSTSPLPTPELGYLVISAPDASSSYAFSLFP